MASPIPCFEMRVVEPVMKRKLKQEVLLASIERVSSAP